MLTIDCQKQIERKFASSIYSTTKIIIPYVEHVKTDARLVSPLYFPCTIWLLLITRFSYLLIQAWHKHVTNTTFSIPLGFLNPYKEPAILCNITLMSIWLKMIWTQLITRLYKNSLTLTSLYQEKRKKKTQYLTDITIWIPMSKSLIPLLISIMNTRAVTYIYIYTYPSTIGETTDIISSGTSKDVHPHRVII